ncbi:Response regulator receiver modulated metal dependent phosphohydrolase (fragment) [Candidatus Zixiibacteriota bacterium]
MKTSVTILIVDDEPLVRSVLEQLLQRKGYSIKAVGGGREALEQLKSARIDLVVSDIRMPEMDGFELLQVVKKSFPDVGVIMMTGYGDAGSVKEALSLGADEYITKPFKGPEVSLIIERAYWRFLSNQKNFQMVQAKAGSH